MRRNCKPPKYANYSNQDITSKIYEKINIYLHTNSYIKLTYSTLQFQGLYSNESYTFICART